MVARTLEELQIHQLSAAIGDEVSAILERPAFRREPKLKDQLDRSSSCIAPLIAEGFGQQTDRHFAHFLYRARGSCNETRSHLAKAVVKRCISKEECEALSERYVVIGKMITRFIQHLRKENRRWRG